MADAFRSLGSLKPKENAANDVAKAYEEILGDVSSIFPRRIIDEHGPQHIYIPDFVFPPDGWTKVFQAGLEEYGSRYSFSGKTIAEIGVGSGINALYLLKGHEPKEVLGSDINDKTALAAAWNVGLNLPSKTAEKYKAVLGGWNLADWMTQKGKIDVFIGCLPQAPLPKGVDIKAGNHYGDYYDAEKFEDGTKPELKAYAHRMNELGLGLNNSALATFNKKLNVGAHVILNFGGRPGIGNLEEMFTANGFKMSILKQSVVEQDAKTDITPFVQREKELQAESNPDFTFEFFADPEGTQKISAAEAHKLRDIEHRHIYHKIYVLLGEKTRELE